jgi:predicted acylesterase/phospholipase RssA
MKTCFIFAGGGARGAVQVGQLRALIENNILPNYLIGVSVGALNAAKITETTNDLSKESFLKSVSQLENVWSNIDTRKKIYKLNNWQQIIRLKTDSLLTLDPLKNLILSIDGKKIINSPLKLDIIVSTANSAYEEIFSNRQNNIDEETIKMAILASASIPGLFPLVEINGKKYFDGSFTAPLPVYLATKEYDKVFVLLTDSQPPTKSIRPQRHISWLDNLVLGNEISRAKIAVMENNWIENINKNLAVTQKIKNLLDEKSKTIFQEEEKNFRFYNKKNIEIKYIYSKNLPSTLRALLFKPDDIKKAIENGYKDALELLK